MKSILISSFSYLLVGVGTILFSLWAVSSLVTPSYSNPSSGQKNTTQGKGTGSASGQELAISLDQFDVRVFVEPFIYDPKGRRDPFEPYEEQVRDEGVTLGPLLPLQRFDLDQLRLVGIIWEVEDPKAMFLDPQSNVHVIGKDDRVGRNNGYVAMIREGEVVVIEATNVGGDRIYSSRVIRLSR